MIQKKDKLFDLEVLKDKQYRWVKLYMSYGSSITIVPRNVERIERVDDDIGLVKIITKTRIFYFNREDIVMVDMDIDNKSDPMLDYVLSSSQEYIVNALTSKKNEIVTIYFSTSPVTKISINPSRIKSFKMLDNGDGIAIVFEVDYETYYMIMGSILRMEVSLR